MADKDALDQQMIAEAEGGTQENEKREERDEENEEDEEEEEEEDENLILNDEADEEIEEELKKYRRCQRRKKRKKVIVTNEEVVLFEGEEDEETKLLQKKNENENEEEEGEDEEEEADEEMDEGSLSEYSSILSAVPFEWENEYYEFLDLCNPGTMDDISHRELVAPLYDINGRYQYLRYCDDLLIPPVVKFYKALDTNEADLSFHGINKKQMFAICAGLESNENVTNLILKENLLSKACCMSLSRLFRNNNTIRCLDLSGCRIGPEGALALFHGISDNAVLKELNLSKCYIEDEGAKSMIYSLRENKSIEKLILSFNKLGAGAAEGFGTLFYSNNSINYLDLANNFLFDSESMKKFFRGLSSNMTVTYLSLNWNGISTNEIGTAISQYLRKSASIQFLDLSDNRLDSQSVRPLKRGLSGSKTIEVLKLARNPLAAEDAAFLLSGVRDCPSLKILDLDEIWVKREFLKSLSKILLVRDVEVIFGGVLSNYVINGPDYPALILKRAHYEAMKPKKKKKKRDFGHLMFNLGDESLTKDQFMDHVKKFNAKINKDLYPELMKQFTIPKVNMIDVVAMRSKYLTIFPDATPPEPKKSKKKGKKGVVEENEQELAKAAEGNATTEAPISDIKPLEQEKTEPEEEMSQEIDEEEELNPEEEVSAEVEEHTVEEEQVNDTEEVNDVE